MNTEYEKMFQQRGDAYAEAMRRFPRSRWREFDNLFAHIDRGALRRVLDIPSGGGYLQEHLPEGVELMACDPSEAFRAEGQHVQNVDLQHPELPLASFDLAVCLAAIHHIAEKAAFIQSLLDSIKPQGWVVVGDVLAQSPIASFLDDFVGQHNGTGHHGMYLTGKPQADFGLSEDSVDVIASQLIPCDWRFENVDDLVTFSRLLFHLSGVTDAEIEAALTDFVGITRHAKCVTLNWELYYVTIQRVVSLD